MMGVQDTHICYLGHIISYTVLAGSQLYLRYVFKLWEMILISIQKAIAFQKSMDLESVGLARCGYQAACPHPCWSGVQPALHTWPWALSLVLSVSRPKFLPLQPAGTRGPWKGFGDQEGQNVREVQNQMLCSPKADRFYLSVTLLSFFWNQEHSAKMRFQVPTKLRG